MREKIHSIACCVLRGAYYVFPMKSRDATRNTKHASRFTSPLPKGAGGCSD